MMLILPFSVSCIYCLVFQNSFFSHLYTTSLHFIQALSKPLKISIHNIIYVVVQIIVLCSIFVNTLKNLPTAFLHITFKALGDPIPARFSNTFFIFFFFKPNSLLLLKSWNLGLHSYP